MMGRHARWEALFYYFRLEDQVPENHLLRLIDQHIDLGFVRERLQDSYSDTGRPSIDPELLLRILLMGYLYGITSERKLVQELRMHLAWRWFTAIAVLPESNSTTAAAICATAPMRTSAPASVVARVRKKRNARAEPSALPATA